MSHRARKIIKASALLLLVLAVILVAVVLINPYGKLKHLIFDIPTESIKVETSSNLSSLPSSHKGEGGNKQNTTSSEDEYANVFLHEDLEGGEVTYCEICGGVGYLDCEGCYATGITEDGGMCLVCYGDGKIPCEH